MKKKVVSEWGHINKIAYKMHATSESGDVAQFVCRPEITGEPIAYNIELGYKLNEWFIDRIGKRYIKIKRFGKTKRYYTTKWVKTKARILNDNWIHNLRAE